MTVKETAHAYKLRQWSELICECKASGKSVKLWCEEQGVCIKTYYYWQKRVRETACEQLPLKEATDLRVVPASEVPSFTEYRPPSRNGGSAAVTLHLSGSTVEINNGANASVIESTLKALKNIC